MTDPNLVQRQVDAVKAVTDWLTELANFRGIDPVRSEGVKRIVRLIELALEKPDDIIKQYR